MSFYLFMCLWTAGTLALVTTLTVIADRDSQRQHQQALSPDPAGDQS